MFNSNGAISLKSDNQEKLNLLLFLYLHAEQSAVKYINNVSDNDTHKAVLRADLMARSTV